MWHYQKVRYKYKSLNKKWNHSVEYGKKATTQAQQPHPLTPINNRQASDMLDIVDKV
jgi:hypothetical protein